MTLYLTLIIFFFLGLSGYAAYGFFPITPFSFRLYPLLGHNMHYQMLKIPRAENIYIPSQCADSVRQVTSYIVKNTQPDEPVFVFPYAPIYYFLANRPTAAKLSVCSASQRTDREAIIRDIENKKVKYIIYTKYMKSVLGVSVESRFPEIIDYISSHYEADQIFDDIVILRRKNKI